MRYYIITGRALRENGSYTLCNSAFVSNGFIQRKKTEKEFIEYCNKEKKSQGVVIAFEFTQILEISKSDYEEWIQE